MVAKSYQNLEIIKEPYDINGRMYVQVQLGNGNTKQVRWYTNQEYAKYYGEQPVAAPIENKTQKEALGFANGYITIFKGDTYQHKDYFKNNGAKYKKWWGWGLAGDAFALTDLPQDITPIRLDWEVVGNEDGTLKAENIVQFAVESLIYPPSGEFVGSIGDRIEIEVTVEKAIQLDGFYGPSTLHSMVDSENHIFVWTTGSKSWAEGSVHHIRGTIKDHKIYRGISQTILTRCAEVKGK